LFKSNLAAFFHDPAGTRQFRRPTALFAVDQRLNRHDVLQRDAAKVAASVP
jgi:hypothetical protein